MTRHRRGFVLGKFMPPHAGHVRLIETAAAQVDELTVLVCTVEREPIPGGLRYEWMCRLFPDLRVVHVTDDVPSYPHESPHFESIWTALLSRTVPNAEVFFSSEEYGDDVARWLGIEHVSVDPGRRVFPVSSTDVRESPARYWDFIPEVVRPHCVTAIALLGPESTGKSTLAARLAERFGTVHVQEYARDAFDWSDRGRELEPVDIERFCSGQAKRIEAARGVADRLLFVDTEAITSWVWSRLYFGSAADVIKREADSQRFALYLLLDVDVPWTDDGTRGFRRVRERHLDMLRNELERRRAPYVLISGSWQERLERASAAVQALL